jgi:hypothetical protein
LRNKESRLLKFQKSSFVSSAHSSWTFNLPPDDAVGILLEEGIGRKPAGLTAGGAEEMVVYVIVNSGRFDIVLQALIETILMRPKYQGWQDLIAELAVSIALQVELPPTALSI